MMKGVPFKTDQMELLWKKQLWNFFLLLETCYIQYRGTERGSPTLGSRILCKKATF